jgi:phosphatidylserine decarboxylase
MSTLQSNTLKASTIDDLSVNEFKDRYHKRFGVISGYLPKDLNYIGKWLSDLIEKALEEKKNLGDDFQYKSSIEAMKCMLDNSPELHAKVEEMIQQGLLVHADHERDVPYRIKSINDMLDCMNCIIQNAPKFDPNVSHSAFPMSGLFVYMMATPAGFEVFKNKKFNQSLAAVLEQWCAYLDSTDSLDVITTQHDGWLSKESVIANNLNQFVTEEDKKLDPKHWEFKSYNDFFHRQIIEITRPIDGQGNDNVIVSANDGTVYNIANNVERETDFEIKGQPYSLVNMLDNSYVDHFVGGDVLQTFLSGNDYHRWRAPISGVVKEQRVVPGYMFSELKSEGWDPTAGTYSQGYEANVNTRGLVFIESDDPAIGMVCVMPIGITEISSIRINVKDGQRVKKGEELGWFSYGGSSMCLIFQKGAIAQFTVPNPLEDNDSDNGPFVRVNAQIAIANTAPKNKN